MTHCSPPSPVIETAGSTSCHGWRWRPCADYDDVDTSVCPIFGDGIEGAEKGHNPQYHGRNSYHPLLARIAESGTLLGAQLRPGKATLGGSDVAQLDRWLTALDAFLDDSPCLVTVRIDKGGDCAALFKVIAKHRRRFLVKARMTPDLVSEIVSTAKWATTEYDADGTVITQVAEIDFVRGEWREQGLPPIRVVAVRSRERQGGKHLDDSELTVQAFFTNDWDSEAEDVVLEYDERAGIEPLLAELKQQWGLEKVSSHDFGANAALMLLKGLAMNLLQRLAKQQAPTVAQRWRTYGLRRLLILRPARLVRTGRRVIVRLGGLPVEPKQEPGLLTPMTKKRSVSSGLPGPTRLSHQPVAPCSSTPATWWLALSAWHTSTALLRSALSVP